MRILLLTLYFAPDVAANAVIMTELAEQIVKSGHDVTVVTSFPHYASNAIAPEYQGRLFERDQYKGINVIRTYLYTLPNKQKMMPRLLNYLSFNALSTLASLFEGPYDIILAPSPPLTIGFTAWAVSRLKRIPYIYNVQDIYPDIAIRLGVLTNPQLIRFFTSLESFVYRKAAAITVLSQGFQANLLAKGVPQDKVRIIPNFVETDFVRPLPKDNSFARQHDLQDKFVVMYAGNVGMSQGLDVMLEAATHLEALSDILLLIVGNGAAKAGLEQQAAQMGLGNVSFLPFQSRSVLPEMYATADVSLVCLRRNIGSESVPSKAYTIMSSGRPLLAAVSEEAETKTLIEQAECGLWVEPEEPRALADAIRLLYHDSALRSRLGKNGRAEVQANYTPKRVAKQYVQLLESLV